MKVEIKVSKCGEECPFYCFEWREKGVPYGPSFHRCNAEEWSYRDDGVQMNEQDGFTEDGRIPDGFPAGCPLTKSVFSIFKKLV
jgi:hypothetical protein